MVSLRASAVLCVNVCGVYAAEQGSLAQKSTGGASSAVELARETIPPRKLRGMQLPPRWGQLGGLAADEGNQLGDVAFLALPSECMAHCDADSDCNSVTYCHEWGGCFLKDQVFTGNEATSSNRDCSTYYRTKGTTTTTSMLPRPTSNAWRVRADSTESGWAWDVRTLTFKDANGADLQLGDCQAFSSGSASDTKHVGIPGYEAEHAFDGSNLWWGGRSGSTGKFFLGLRCEQQYAVAQVQIQQGDTHYAQEVTVEWQDEADNWVPLETASGLSGGRISGSPEDWSMERIYPSGLSSIPSTTSMSTTTPSTSSKGASCKFSVVFCGYSGYSSGEDTSTPPPPENWELMVGECSPDGRGGAYRVEKPSSTNPYDPECGIASPYFVHVDHYQEETCTSAKDDSSFMVFTDGYCGNCCDINTGVCNSRCAGFLSPA